MALRANAEVAAEVVVRFHRPRETERVFDNIRKPGFVGRKVAREAGGKSALLAMREDAVGLSVVWVAGGRGTGPSSPTRIGTVTSKSPKTRSTRHSSTVAPSAATRGASLSKSAWALSLSIPVDPAPKRGFAM